jgi:hypothetical protein
MVHSLKRLLGESVDFSGLIGPEGMSAEEALERYLRYREGPQSWLLSRFVCPAKQLGGLSQKLATNTLEVPVPVTVLGSPTASAAQWEDELAACAILMNDFEVATPDGVEVAAFEIRPPENISPNDVLKDLRGFSEVDVFIEAPRIGQFDGLSAAIADSEWAYLKIDLSRQPRPDSFAVAKLLHEAVAIELPFKVVQGKGSPITNEREYGLINLFGAVAIGLAEDLSSREMEAILTDGEVTHWDFSPNSITFHGWEASAESIEQARDLFVEAQCHSVEYVLDELSTLGFAVRQEN